MYQQQRLRDRFNESVAALRESLRKLEDIQASGLLMESAEVIHEETIAQRLVAGQLASVSADVSRARIQRRMPAIIHNRGGQD